MKNMRKSREIQLYVNTSETGKFGWDTNLGWVANPQLDMSESIVNS
jgi:hypothetical protein